MPQIFYLPILGKNINNFHSNVWVGRDLLRSSSSTASLKQGQLDKGAQDCMQLGSSVSCLEGSARKLLV